LDRLDSILRTLDIDESITDAQIWGQLASIEQFRSLSQKQRVDMARVVRRELRDRDGIFVDRVKSKGFLRLNPTRSIEQCRVRFRRGKKQSEIARANLSALHPWIKTDADMAAFRSAALEMNMEKLVYMIGGLVPYEFAVKTTVAANERVAASA